jgi:hypothetical protein
MQKVIAQSAKEKKRYFAPFPHFAAPHWKPGSRPQSHWAAGRARILRKVYVKLKMNFYLLFHYRYVYVNFMYLHIVGTVS